jgi:hypothetical protein
MLGVALALALLPAPRLTVYAPPGAVIPEPTAYVQAAACDWLERTAPEVLAGPLPYRLVRLAGAVTQAPGPAVTGTVTC